MGLLTQEGQEKHLAGKDCGVGNDSQRVEKRIVTILGGVNWNKHHKNGAYLVYKQIPTGEVKEEEVKLVKLEKREEYVSAQEFIDERNILEKRERLPTRGEVLSLGKGEYLFMDDRNYLFDDGENGLGVFRKGQDLQVEIIPISQVSYAYIRTIIEE